MARLRRIFVVLDLENRIMIYQRKIEDEIEYKPIKKVFPVQAGAIRNVQKLLTRVRG